MRDLELGRDGDEHALEVPERLDQRLLALVCDDDERERIVRLYGESEKTPEKRLEEKDNQRRAYYKHYTGNEWGMYSNYDLSLNTSVVGIERAAQFIVEVAKSPFEGSPTDHPL